MPGLQAIAVGFDGSADSEVALAWAAGLAHREGGRLVVVHAVGLLEHAGMSHHVAAHQETAVRIAGEAGMDPDDVVWSPVDGDPCSALLRTIGQPPVVDLVVVGSRGAGAHGGSVLGSTSLELTERSPVPVVIVPTGAHR